MKVIFMIIVAINKRSKPFDIRGFSKRSKEAIDIKALQLLDSQLLPRCAYNTLHTAEEERLNMLGRACSKLQIAASLRQS